jgi:hypothetical protein
MSPHLTTDDDEIVWFSIPLNGETIERLMNLSNECHAEPVQVAASLLHDILKDDENAHLEAPAAAGPKPRLN